jgi:hypothetical protein
MGLSESVLFTSDSSEWLNFLPSQSQATLFHHPAWINLLGDFYHFVPRYLLIKDNDHVRAGIPFLEVSGLFKQNKLVSLPFTDHCAPLFTDPAALAKLIDALAGIWQEGTYQQIEIRWPFPPAGFAGNDVFLRHPSPSKQLTQYVLSDLKLDPDPQKVADQIKAKDFRHIRVAQRRGVSLDISSKPAQLEAFYQLHCLNRRRHGLPTQSWKFFQALYDKLIRQGYGFIITAEHEHTCVAGGIFLYWNNHLIEKYSAVNSLGRHLLAMDLILWQAICWGCEHFMSNLDLGRSDIGDEGLREYKLRWGATEINLPYTYLLTTHHQAQADKLKEYPSTRHKEALIEFLKNIIRRSPVWVSRLTGQLFYHYLA